MKPFMGFVCALVACLAIACKTTDAANEKIDDCIAEEYGTDTGGDEMQSSLELTCEDGEQACDDCVDCVMDLECDAVLEGDCESSCK
jgi:hypothetical protein